MTVAPLARTVVDGVPVYSCEVPGPVRAMLAFRVGVIDETLPTHGITHLVEHLAMYPLMQRADTAGRVNALVDPWRTRFIAHGTADEVTSFLASVTANLAELPVDRVESEKKVLRTEAANRPSGSLKSAWTWRFGTSGLGVADFEEFGLRWLGAEHVRRWAGDRFTAGNAVLWITGPVPDGLRLHLAPGERKPLPDVRPLGFKTPGVYQQGDRWVAHSMLGPRNSAFFVGARVLDRRLRERLRHERSLAYETSAGYQRLDKQVGEVTSYADSLAPNAAEAAAAVAAIVGELAQAGPRLDELASIVEERRRHDADPDAPIARMEQAAIAELEGLPTTPPDQLEAEMDALQPPDVAAVFAEAQRTALLALPKDVPMTIEGFTPVPVSLGRQMHGVQLVPMPGSGHSDRLDFSGEGISVTVPNRTVVAMRWSEIAAALWWSDGRRMLVGPDGAIINLVPSKWREAGPLLGVMQREVAAERWIPMDEAGSVPQHGGPVCSVCRSTPAIEMTLQNPRSLFAIRLGRVHGLVCRDCGIAKFRQVQRQVLVRGWWSIPGLVVTPVALVMNVVALYRIKALDRPIHSSGINPLAKGRTVWLYPGMLIPAALAGFLLWIFWPR